MPLNWKNGTVLISGAGLIGLTTAHMLNKLSIPFIIFEQDENVDSRGQGWGITLHWALDDLLSMLPPSLQKEIYQCQVIDDFNLKDSGNFLYINADTGETLVKIPPAKRLRVRREQIRKALIKGLNINWGDHSKSVTINKDAKDVNERVIVTCSNGKVFKGGLLLDCEGRGSCTRKLTNPTNYDVHKLPIRFIGGIVELSETEYQALAEKFDPLLFQGTVPSTNTFFWFSVLSTPQNNGTSKYKCQVNFSWKMEGSEPFQTPDEKWSALNQRSKGLNLHLEILRQRLLDNKDNFTMVITIADWPHAEWNDFGGLVLLAGDSAHAMVMYRGEAANHGIVDVKLLEGLMKETMKGDKSWKACTKEYQTKLNQRAKRGVLLSRQACLDAHNWDKISVEGNDSPLLAIRKRFI